MHKHIFITGGVLSSLGKGLTCASIGLLMERRGYKVAMQKMDPYINVDAGTMNPLQHGEVYVTEDGLETDLDLGHYERFTNAEITRDSNYTTGRIYDSVIEKERTGKYLGQTVQVIPHITDEIKSAIHSLARPGIDIIITEIGGTIGDIEGLPFIEAIRQIAFDCGRENVLYIHITLVPYLTTINEHKTKPTQQSVAKLREIGIQPDIIICRTSKSIPEEAKNKISLFCNVDKNAVFEELDVRHSIYEIPIMLRQQKLDKLIATRLGLDNNREPDLSDWEQLLENIRHPDCEIKIGIVGKYYAVQDSYKSIHEALAHGGFANRCKVEILKIPSEDIKTDSDAKKYLQQVDGVLVPGGFGEKRVEGKILSTKYAREDEKPFFGICFGFQLAIVEIARNVLGLSDSNTTEIQEDTPHPVIHMMQSQMNITHKGATMRLGAYPCKLVNPSKAFDAYRQEIVYERHRHRYEFNNKYKEQFEKAGVLFSGICPEHNLVEIMEIKEHPWFVGVQFHPEFRSKPISAHPLFREFIKASIKHKKR